MYLPASSLGFLLWLLLASAIGVHVHARSRAAMPAIEARARALNVLERVLVAVRSAARQPSFDTAGVRAALARHGVRASEEPVRDGGELVRMRVRVSASDSGELRVITAADGQLVAVVRCESVDGCLEARALVRAPGAR